MTLTLATLIAGTGARTFRLTSRGPESGLSPGDLERPCTEITIDSRRLQPGSLFVALAGNRTDGHHFVPDALRTGALAALVERMPANLPDEGFLLLVPDALQALQHLATYWRRKHAAEIIGITGSIGKTTTKEIVAGVLAAAMPVLKSEANLNTEIGLPLMLLRVNGKHRAAVLEMGMHERGDIALLSQIAEPTTGIVTTVAPVHLERMGSIEAIAREKSRVIAALPPDGLALLNGDNRWTRAMAQTSGVAPALTFGLEPQSDLRAVGVTPLGLEGVRFVLQAEGEKLPVQTRVPGVHTVPAFLAAAGVARRLGMTWPEIQQAMASVRLEARQNLLPGPAGSIIIDDSYNAAPPSMRAALDLLRAAPGEHIAVLGDMLELGPDEEAAHREVGEVVATRADWLVVRGERADWIAQAAEEHGLAGRVRRTASNAEAVSVIQEIMGANAFTMSGVTTPQWTILVKGSRGMKMEEVVSGLRGEL